MITRQKKNTTKNAPNTHHKYQNLQ